MPPAATVCGRKGYTIQVSFPRQVALETVREMIEIFHRSPCPPVKAIMRVHRQDDHLISFSEDGYSLNFELHPKKRHQTRMRPVVNALIECVIWHGGKVHLAKDMILTREQFQRLYPRYGAFLSVKRRLDPQDLFASDMYRRLIRVEAASPAAPAEEVPEIHVVKLAAPHETTG